MVQGVKWKVPRVSPEHKLDVSSTLPEFSSVLLIYHLSAATVKFSATERYAVPLPPELKGEQEVDEAAGAQNLRLSARTVASAFPYFSGILYTLVKNGSDLKNVYDSP